MATFNVFVEGAVDDSPMGLPQLAEAMSQRYGLVASDLVSRLRRGRFRVKSAVEAATAERLKRDLEAIGARVLVEDSAISPTATPVAGVPTTPPSSLSLSPSNVAGARHPPPSGLAATGPSQPRPSTPPPRPSAPPSALAGIPRTPDGPAHQRPSTPIPGEMVSGLAAAFGESAHADLGALGEGALSLASLDGEQAPASSNMFDAPPEPPAASITIAPAKPQTTKLRTKPALSQPMDLFAPPDAGDQDLRVDLATEEIDEQARKQASAPLATITATASQSQPRPRVVAEAAVAVAPKQLDRVRFVVGVVLALAIGFIPAHFVAKLREASELEAIDARIAQLHASADTQESWLALDSARAKLRDEKASKRQMIALTSMLLWAGVAAAVAFGFSRIPVKNTA